MYIFNGIESKPAASKDPFVGQTAASLNLTKSVLILYYKSREILQQFPYTSSITNIRFSFRIVVIVQKNSIEYRFVVVQTVNKVQIHCLSQMIKATNKHGFLLSKIVDIKRFLQMSPVHKGGKFKIFSDFMKP